MTPTDPEAQKRIEALERQVADLERQHEHVRTRYEEATRAGHVGVWDWDFETDATYISLSLKRMLGFRDDELSDEIDAWRDRIHPDDLDDWDSTLQTTLEGTGDSYASEHRVLTRTGDVLWLGARGRVFRNAEGKAIRISGTSVDITDRKEAELAREVLEVRLHSAHKLEAIGTLAGGIAHDFNNILAVVLGNAQLGLEKDKDSESARENLEEILKAGIRGRDIVRQLLAFSREGEGERHSVPIRPAIQEAVRFVRPFMPASIRIRTSFHGDAHVEIEVAQIHQMLLNLCANARDAMPDGGSLSVSLRVFQRDEPFRAGHRDLPPGEWVMLTVEDEGHGIEPEVLPRVFDPFFTTKPMGKGTGLGLAMVYGIASDHGGDVLIESERNEGTTVRIWLPVSTEPAEAEEEELLPVVTGHGRVLFVDDEDAVVRVARAMLESLGYQVLSFASPTDALHAFRKSPDAFDVVITDQSMPGLTGLNLARKVREVRPDVPVLLCTGYSDSISRETLTDASIGHILMKPFLVGELSQMLEEVCGHGKASSV